MKFCHYRKDGRNDKYDGHYMSFDEDYCCGEPATCNVGVVWFCAFHYDLWTATYGDPKQHDIAVS